MLIHIERWTNNFENMNFMMYWWGNQVFNYFFNVLWLMDYHNMIWVFHLKFVTLLKWPSTINVTNFAIPSFIWINMSGMIYWTWNIYINVLLFHGLGYYRNMMRVLLSFYVLVWYCNTLSSFKIYVIEPKGFMGFPTRGIACALNISNH